LSRDNVGYFWIAFLEELIAVDDHFPAPYAVIAS